MLRLNLILLAVLIACALALVTSQHQARKLYVELQKEQELAKQLDVEWGQLQLEQSTWATHARVEKLATRALGMRVPPASRIQRRAAAAPRGPAVSPAAHPHLALQLPAWRSRLLLLALLAWFAALAGARSTCRGCTTTSCSRRASRATRA